MYLANYLDTQAEACRDAIMDRLLAMAKNSSIHHQLFQNFLSECQMDHDDWAELCNFVVLQHHGIVDLEGAIKEFCRQRLEKGRRATVAVDQVYGRVTTLASHVDMLVKEGHFLDEHEARAWVRSAISRELPGLLQSDLRYPLGRHLMWSTFEPGKMQPLRGVQQSATSYLCCALGLHGITSPLLVMEYTLPPAVRPLVPTVCHAYAAETWSRYFRPPNEHAPYGLTMPTDTCADQRGRPEVVHGVLHVADLVRQMVLA